MNLLKLTEILKQTSRFFKFKAVSAVNISLTLRNWLFGYYIVEYEQKGEDRAKYGDNLLKEISNIANYTISGFSVSHLRIYRQFYKTYPEIANTILELTPEFSISEIHQTVSGELEKDNNLIVPPLKLIKGLSFSHFVELIKISDPLKRTFYEIESINGTWSVRELKRQIATLYFERSGLSKNREKLKALK